jgi:hypothetical protein
MQLNEIEASEEEEAEPTPSEPGVSSRTERKKDQPRSSTPTIKKSKNKKKKRKPGKDEGSIASTPGEVASSSAPELDAVDRAIKEISLKYGESPTPSQSQSTTHLAKYSLVTIQPKFLDAEQELRKLFGKIVDQEKRERQSIPGVPAHVFNRIKASQKTQKHTLMNPKDEWKLFAAYNKRMLSMDIIGKEGVITKFKFTHSRRYEEVQMSFFLAALSGNSEALMRLLGESPFHVDTWYFLP